MTVATSFASEAASSATVATTVVDQEVSSSGHPSSSNIVCLVYCCVMSPQPYHEDEVDSHPIPQHELPSRAILVNKLSHTSRISHILYSAFSGNFTKQKQLQTTINYDGLVNSPEPMALLETTPVLHGHALAPSKDPNLLKTMTPLCMRFP